MWLIGGVIGAICAVAFTALAVAAATGNLPASEANAVRIIVLAAAVVFGALAGSAVLDRARRSRQNLARFSATAVALSFGMLTAIATLALFIAYTAAYGNWPQAISDYILFVLAFPVFAAAGFAIGALGGFLVGLAVGGALRLVPVGTR